MRFFGLPKHANTSAATPLEDADREWQLEQQRLDKTAQLRTKHALHQLRKAAKHVDKVQKQHARQVRRQQRKSKRLERARMHVYRQERRRQQRAVRRLRKQANRARIRAMEADAATAAAAHAAALGNEERTLPAPTTKQPRCASCSIRFQALKTWRHYCGNCGHSVCRKCLSTEKRTIPGKEQKTPQRVCIVCDLTVFDGRGNQDQAAASSSAIASASAVSAAAGTPKPSPASNPVSSDSEASASLRERPNSATKQRKYSRWLLPLRPFLKRKASVKRLQHGQEDAPLLAEKHLQLQGNAHAIELASASAPVSLH